MQNLNSDWLLKWFANLSDEVLEIKVNRFLSRARNIIKKTKWQWESLYSFKSSHEVSPEQEMI